MRPERSQAKREIDWYGLIQAALVAPGNVGNVYNRFYDYSFMNQMLLLAQGVREPVATYKRWQDMGRQVVKGARAKEIIRPIMKVEKDEETGEQRARRIGFKAVRCIFGVSDTTGAELPPAPEVPDWSVKLAMKNLDIEQVPYDSLSGNTQGYSFERKVAINPVAVFPLKTTLHEMGHIVCGHTERVDEYHRHRGAFEFQAEATSYLVMNEVEAMDDAQRTVSHGYIQSWMEDDRPSDVAIREVFKATDLILHAGRLCVEADLSTPETEVA